MTNEHTTFTTEYAVDFKNDPLGHKLFNALQFLSDAEDHIFAQTQGREPIISDPWPAVAVIREAQDRIGKHIAFLLGIVR